MSSLTPNYNLVLPGVNDPTDQDLWGGMLNSNFKSLDTIIFNTNSKFPVSIANGGTGAITAPLGFDNLKQDATNAYSGVVEYADTTELASGAANRAVSPSQVKSFFISRYTMSSTVSQTIPIPAGFGSCEFEIRNLRLSTNANLGYQICIDGTGTNFITSSTYQAIMYDAVLNQASGPEGGTTYAFSPLSSVTWVISSGFPYNSKLTLFSPNSSSQQTSNVEKCTYVQSTTGTTLIGVHHISSFLPTTSPITHIRILPTVGNMVSGTIDVLGVR